MAPGPGGGEAAAVAVFTNASTALPLLLLAAFLLKGLRILRSPKTPSHVQCEYAVALRSALVYVAMAVPTLVFTCTVPQGGTTVAYSWGDCPASPYTLIPTNFMRIYHWLPFWFVFFVTTHLGGFIDAVRQGVTGTAIAAVSMSFMNYLMPGGAGLLSQDPESIRRAWLPGGYSTPATLLCALLFVYGVSFFKGDVGTKQYALALFSNWICLFMNPATEKGFRAILWDWNFEWNWNGIAMCEIWLIMLAMVISILPLGFFPCSRSWREKHTCMGHAARSIHDLALDTKGCLAWLLTNFVEKTLVFDGESSFAYIRQLGARRTTIEGLLAEAKWECYGEASSAHLRVLWRFSDLLRSLRQMLRVELEHVRSLGHTVTAIHTSEVAGHLSDYLAACGDALSTFADHAQSGELGGQSAQRVSDAAQRAESALIASLERLNAADSAMGELALIDSLRSWPALIRQTLDECEGKPSTGTPPAHMAAQGATATLCGHFFAVKNTVIWMLALWWAVCRRSYNSGCVVCCTSLIFSATSGSTFDRNINRMVGIGMGLGIGNVPAILVMHGMQGEPGAGSLPYIATYFVLMFVMWSVGIYGYLASGSKYSYACLLWVGFAGVQMLRHIQTFDRSRGLFVEIIDNFFACLLVFLVDVAITYLFSVSTSKQLHAAAYQCIGEIAVIVEGLNSGVVADVSLAALPGHIKAARFWQSELSKETLVWTSLWEVSHAAEFLNALLNYCDDVYLAAYAIQVSAGRCSNEKEVSAVIQEVLIEDFVGRCHAYVGATHSFLMGGELNAELLDTLLGRSAERASSGTKFTRKYTHELLAELCEQKACASEESMLVEAAASAVKINAISLRMALRGIGGLLAAQVSLASRDWRAPCKQNGTVSSAAGASKEEAMDALRATATLVHRKTRNSLDGSHPE